MLPTSSTYLFVSHPSTSAFLSLYTSPSQLQSLFLILASLFVPQILMNFQANQFHPQEKKNPENCLQQSPFVFLAGFLVWFFFFVSVLFLFFGLWVCLFVCFQQDHLFNTVSIQDQNEIIHCALDASTSQLLQKQSNTVLKKHLSCVIEQCSKKQDQQQAKELLSGLLVCTLYEYIVLKVPISQSALPMYNKDTST